MLVIFFNIGMSSMFHHAILDSEINEFFIFLLSSMAIAILTGSLLFLVSSRIIKEIKQEEKLNEVAVRYQNCREIFPWDERGQVFSTRVYQRY